MSYATCRDALKTVLTGATEQITIGDYLPLDHGVTTLLVLTAGAASGVDLLSMRPSYEWAVNVDLYVRTEQTDAETHAAFETVRDTVIALLAGAPDMGNSIYIEGYATEADLMAYYDKQGGGPFHLGQRITVVMREEI